MDRQTFDATVNRRIEAIKAEELIKAEQQAEELIKAINAVADDYRSHAALLICLNLIKNACNPSNSLHANQHGTNNSRLDETGEHGGSEGDEVRNDKKKDGALETSVKEEKYEAHIEGYDKLEFNVLSAGKGITAVDLTQFDFEKLG